jgi:hypothetical protein
MLHWRGERKMRHARRRNERRMGECKGPINKKGQRKKTRTEKRCSKEPLLPKKMY